MKCSCAVFPKTIRYESPAHGGWGLVRMAGLLPESHMLFYTPAACGRHSSLGALSNGIKDRVSYLFLSEDEIVSGSYEKEIIPAVERLFEALGRKPKALLLFGGCIDDFLGTDYQALKGELSRRHPDVRFCFCHMNPIQLDTKSPPGVTLFTNIYSMLERRDKNRDQVNFIGNNVIPAESSEIWDILKAAGVSAKMLPGLRTFSDFLSMSESSLNVVLSPRCLQSAAKQRRDLGIDYLAFIPSYDPEEISSFYESLIAELKRITGRDFSFDMHDRKDAALRALEETAEKLNGIGVIIDFQAVSRPFTLARVLLEYGFDVRMVASDGVSRYDKASFDYLQQIHPDLEVVDPLHHDAPKYKERYLHECLSIGFDAAFMTGAVRIVDIQEDGDLLGFDGIVRLMGMMRDAMERKSDVMDIIREAKLVI